MNSVTEGGPGLVAVGSDGSDAAVWVAPPEVGAAVEDAGDGIEVGDEGGERLPVSPIDVCFFVGLGGLYVGGVLWLARNRSLVPEKDPRLEESLAFENS